MADMKFSCPQCGQHFSCGEAWADHQIQCPTCHVTLTVPRPEVPSKPATLPAPTREAYQITEPKLSAGATQVPRSAAPGPVPQRKVPLRIPQGNSAVVKYAIVLAVVAALGGAGYFYAVP